MLIIEEQFGFFWDLFGEELLRVEQILKINQIPVFSENQYLEFVILLNATFSDL